MLDTKQKENTHRNCFNPDCDELGIYPAPKSRENLREYLYFCIINFLSILKFGKELLRILIISQYSLFNTDSFLSAEILKRDVYLNLLT